MSFSISRDEPVEPQVLAAFTTTHAALRRVQDSFVGAVTDPETYAEVQSLLDQAAAILDKHQAPTENMQIAGKVDELAFRGMLIQPDMTITHKDRDLITGHVVLTKFFLGAGGAAHGGVPPLMFDQLMGDLANTDRVPVRTAYLTTNYRALTPLHEHLDVRVWVEKEEGRKVFMRATISHGETVCVDAEGLFIAPKGVSVVGG